MKETQISLPELALIAGTRGALGFGLGLLLADRWTEGQRRAIGWTLTLVGIATTSPLALDVFGHLRTRPAPVGGQPSGDEFVTEWVEVERSIG